MFGPASTASAQTAACTPSSSIEFLPFLPQGAVGQPYSGVIGAAGVSSDWTVSVVSGSLPLGLSMTPTGGISGTPLVPGDSIFRVQIVDRSSDPPTCNTSGDLKISVIVDTSQAQGQVNGLVGALGRLPTPDCVVATIGAVLGQGPSAGRCF
jgi:hypothetical protein